MVPMPCCRSSPRREECELSVTEVTPNKKLACHHHSIQAIVTDLLAFIFCLNLSPSSQSTSITINNELVDNIRTNKCYNEFCHVSFYTEFANTSELVDNIRANKCCDTFLSRKFLQRVCQQQRVCLQHRVQQVLQRVLSLEFLH